MEITIHHNSEQNLLVNELIISKFHFILKHLINDIVRLNNSSIDNYHEFGYRIYIFYIGN